MHIFIQGTVPKAPQPPGGGLIFAEIKIKLLYFHPFSDFSSPPLGDLGGILANFVYRVVILLKQQFKELIMN
jgi:hypothetical protein